jgi:hypothetical protein
MCNFGSLSSLTSKLGITKTQLKNFMPMNASDLLSLSTKYCLKKLILIFKVTGHFLEANDSENIVATFNKHENNIFPGQITAEVIRRRLLPEQQHVTKE